MALCPHCNKKALDPILKSKPYMIIKESFTDNEMEQGNLFTLSGKNKNGYPENTTSYYLMKELGLVGLNLQIMSLSALWLHNPPTGKKTKEARESFQKCFDYSVGEVIKVAKGKKIVLLMGAEIVRTFTGYGVSEVSGLVCKSDLLPDAHIVIPAPNPDKLMSQPIGELRLAVKTFAEQIKIAEQYNKI